MDADVTRRDFVKGAAAVGAGMMLADRAFAQAAPADGPVLNVALLGAGTQGRVLMNDSLKIPGIRFRAVCDIWEYSRRYSTRRLKSQYKRAGHADWGAEIKSYVDYREMLEKEPELDAVIVATPDFWHAEHTIAALKAGKHVYCEKEMSNSLEKAASMVKAAKETGKMLQIGHQRRSNPVYQYAYKMLCDDKVCGKRTICYGQWDRGVQPLLKWPARYEIPAATLAKYGYENMEQFRNWRWYRKYSAGPIADLGSHQIDIFSWFLQADPQAVVAMGGSDYFGNRQWYEDVLCIYNYKIKEGSARAFYQVLNTNSYGHYFERFGGDGGTITISENPKKCYFVPEPGKDLPPYMASVEPVMHDGHPTIPLLKAMENMGPKGKAAAAEFMAKNVHQMHLENFFTAVRQGKPELLNCPPEEAYKTAVAVLEVIPAVEAGGGVTFKPGQFKA